MTTVMVGTSGKLSAFVRVSSSVLSIFKFSLERKGTAFAKKFKDATLMKDKHEDIFNQLTSTFRPRVIKEWTKAVEDWEAGLTDTNPYQEPISSAFIFDLFLSRNSINLYSYYPSRYSPRACK